MKLYREVRDQSLNCCPLLWAGCSPWLLQNLQSSKDSAQLWIILDKSAIVGKMFHFIPFWKPRLKVCLGPKYNIWKKVHQGNILMFLSLLEEINCPKCSYQGWELKREKKNTLSIAGDSRKAKQLMLKAAWRQASMELSLHDKKKKIKNVTKMKYCFQSDWRSNEAAIRQTRWAPKWIQGNDWRQNSCQQASSGTRRDAEWKQRNTQRRASCSSCRGVS